tara:strand:- start:9302 stop:10837 length:1536 start_codon:yes stop_codon:yes gene_type:complete
MGIEEFAPQQQGLSAEEVKETIQVRAKAKQASLMRQLKGLESEARRRKREEVVRFYEPHAPQARFHSSKARIRLVSGGNRSGKTQGGVAEDVAHALGYRPWLDPKHPDYKIDIAVPNKGLIMGESFGEQVHKVLVAKLLGDTESGISGLLPKPEIKETKKNQQGIITRITLKNGSTISCQSYDQHEELFEGVDIDWAHFDEPPPRPIWVAVQRGLTDRSGSCWITMTPLKEPWIHKELYSRSDVDKFVFDIEDNVGFGLTQEAVDDFARNLSPDEAEARLRGRFFHLTGLVYKEYGAIHRIERRKIEPTWGLWMSIDPHPRTPHHAVWAAALPDGRIYVVGEMKNSDLNNRVAPFAEACLAYELETLKIDTNSVSRIIDPFSKINNPVDGRSMWDEFADHGLVCAQGSKNRDVAIVRMHKFLQHDPGGGVYPLIYFYQDLAGIHWEMENYVWDDWRGASKATRNDKQVPKDKDDHFVECLHRILLDNPEAEDPEWAAQTDKPIIAKGASYG